MIQKENLRTISLLVACLSVSACSSLYKEDAQPLCEGEAKYSVTYESLWTAKTYPIEYPSSDAHYSKLVGATHNDDVTIWQPNAVASKAIQDVAEKGLNHKLEKRVNWLIKIDKAGSYIDGPDLKTGGGKIETTFTSTPDFPNISLISMIAPSPDWFVGVSSLNMCVNGKWMNDYQENLYAIDGGTDSGVNYAYATKETTTSPAEVIKPLVNARLDIRPDKVFGTIKFVKLD